MRREDTGEDTSAPKGPATKDTEALKDAAVETKPLARETQEDLKPFPLNAHFTSQSVLSEELRQEIWRRVQIEGKSVREVSIELGVEMRRVGAVVRLLEVERRMRAEVRDTIFHSVRTAHQQDETLYRLVLQTPPW